MLSEAILTVGGESVQIFRTIERLDRVYCTLVLDRWLSRIALVALAGYLLLGAAVTTGLLRPWDAAMLGHLQQIRHPVADLAFAVVAIVGSSELTAIVLLAAAAWLWVRGRRAVACLFLAYFGLFPFEFVGKAFLPQYPPGEELVRQVYRYPLLKLDLGHSFPSGHAARFAFFTVIAWFGSGYLPPAARTMVRVGLLGMAFPVLWSRVYTGAHWPSDVVGGVLLGVGIASGALAARSRLPSWILEFRLPVRAGHRWRIVDEEPLGHGQPVRSDNPGSRIRLP